jgi:hypothetical protein
MKTYLSSSKYSLLKILPSFDSSQNPTIVEDNALKFHLRVIISSKLFDAPPSSLKDLNVSSKVKTTKGVGV